MRLPARPLLLAPLFVLASFDARAAEFRVGAGIGCTHSSIQAAINAARLAPGDDTILVTQSLVYLNQALTIRDQNVTLIGAYSGCRSRLQDGLRHTVIDGAGGMLASVISVRGTGNVTLLNLELRGGDAVGVAGANRGGGLAVAGGPHNIGLTDVVVRENRATFGGGIALESSALPGDDVVLAIGNDVAIEANQAEASGGGIYCSGDGASVAVKGGPLRIAANLSFARGGGVALDNGCRVALASVAAPANGAMIEANVAVDGAGIAAAGAGTFAQLYTTDSNTPLVVSGNRAWGRGGAIHIAHGAYLDAYDVVLADNRAERGGGAVYVMDDLVPVDRRPARLRMKRDVSDAPAGAVRCAAPKRCNLLVGNLAQAADGAPQPGAALLIHGDGAANLLRAPGALFYGATFENHYGRTLIETVAPTHGYAGARVRLDASLIHRNTAREALLENPPRLDTTTLSSGSITIHSTTIADNKSGSGIVLRSPGETDGSNGRRHLGFRNSIVWQPGSRVVQLAAGVLNPGHLEYVVAHDLAGLPASPTLLAPNDPGFVDAPAGDYRLRLDAAAVDYAPNDPFASPQTIDDGARPVDLEVIPDRFGPFDLGAYERQGK